jgi:hypothetical protein
LTQPIFDAGRTRSLTSHLEVLDSETRMFAAQLGVMRHGTCPSDQRGVAVITLKRVVVATDFCDASKVAVVYGRELAHTFGARLDVLHVVPNLADARGAETKTDV